MSYLELANWDGRLSVSPSRVDNQTSSSAKISTTGVRLLSTTNSSIVMTMSNFNPPSIFTPDGIRIDNDVVARKSPPTQQTSVQANMFQTRQDENHNRTIQEPNMPSPDSPSSDQLQDDDDDDDEQAVDFMLENASPVNQARSIQHTPKHSPRSSITPLPSSFPLPYPRLSKLPHRLLDELFTPEAETQTQPQSTAPVPTTSTPPIPRKKSKKFILTIDHIAIPSLPPGVHKRDYRNGGKAAKIRLDTLAKAVENGQTNSLFEALSKGLRHNAGQAYGASSASASGSALKKKKGKGKGKGKKRAVDRKFLEESDPDSEDNGVVFVSRPLKRKWKTEDDDTDYCNASRPPKKKSNPLPMPKLRRNISLHKSSSPDIPISQVLVNNNNDNSSLPPPLPPHHHHKQESQPPEDTMMLDIGEVGPPPDWAVPTYHAFLASIRHLRTTYQQQGEIRKLWDARHKEGLEVVEYEWVGYMDKQVGDLAGIRTRVVSVPKLTSSEVLESPVKPHGLDVMQQRDAQTMEGSSSNNNPDTIDVDNYLEDLDYSSVVGTAPPLIITSGFEDTQLDDTLAASTMRTLSSPRNTSLPPITFYLPEEFNQSDADADIPSPFLSGIDSLSNNDSNVGFYGTASSASTSNDYRTSPWISGGDGNDFESQSLLEGTASTGGGGDDDSNVWNGTIDPTLLGGGGSLVESHSPSASPSPSPPPQAVRSAIRASPQPLFNDEPVRSLSRRIPRRRHFDGMVPIDDLDLSAQSSESDDSEYDQDIKSGRRVVRSPIKGPSRKSARSSVLPVRRTQRQSTLESSSKVSPEPDPTPPPLPAPPPRRGRALSKTRYPQAEVSTFCHQCRTTSFRMKMKCMEVRDDGSSCNLWYCARCIAKRYPDMTFEPNAKAFACPRCTNICNCTTCARKRGEIYVSGVIPKANGETNAQPNPQSNAQPSVQSSSKVNTKSKQKSNQKPKQQVKPEVVLKLPKNPTKYWGTIYGPSGKKIGTAFVGEDDDNPRVVVPKLITTTSVSTARNRKRRSVFIGMIQECWGSDSHTVRDIGRGGLSRFSGGKGKAKQTDERANWPIVRTYIGKKPPRYPRQPQPLTADVWSNEDKLCDKFPASSSSSPVHSRESSLKLLSTPSPDWPKPDVGESAQFGFVPTNDELKPLNPTTAGDFSLTPARISIAISAALGSLTSFD